MREAARPLVGVGGCESGCAAMSSRSGSTMSGRPGVYRRHCIAAFTKHVLPAQQFRPHRDPACARGLYGTQLPPRYARGHQSWVSPAKTRLMSHSLELSVSGNATAAQRSAGCEACNAARTDILQPDQAARQHRLGLALRLRVAVADGHHRRDDVVQQLRDSGCCR